MGHTESEVTIVSREPPRGICQVSNRPLLSGLRAWELICGAAGHGGCTLSWKCLIHRTALCVRLACDTFATMCHVTSLSFSFPIYKVGIATFFLVGMRWGLQKLMHEQDWHLVDASCSVRGANACELLLMASQVRMALDCIKPVRTHIVWWDGILLQ